MAWISEIHYQNGYATSLGVPEYIEVALTPAEHARAGDFRVADYDLNGTVRSVTTLDSLTPVFDASIGHYIYTVQALITDPDSNTPPPGATSVQNEAEAVALIDTSLPDPVISFYDIGSGTRNITATNGPAQGATSVNIPSAPQNSTIQFAKFGERVDGPITPISAVICFADGTLIETENGPLPVEEITIGTKVRNDRWDLVEVKWLGKRHVPQAELAENEKLRPVRIAAGALGNELPARDLLVSRQHRIFVASEIAAQTVSSAEVLIPAIKLTQLPGITVAHDTSSVTYFHLMLDDHELIWAEGALAESFLPGPEALNALTAQAKAELLLMFPEISTAAAPKPARPVPEAKLQKEIIALHHQQSMALQ